MSHKSLFEVAKQRPSFMEVLHLLPPYTVDDVVNAYQAQKGQLSSQAESDEPAAQQLQSAYERALDHARFQESRRVWLGGRMEVFQRRQELIAEIESLGGSVVLQPNDAYVYEYGEDFAEVLRKLVAVHLTGADIGDASLAWLTGENAALGEVRLLDLSDSKVTAAGLASISALTGLRCLDLRNSTVGTDVVDLLIELRSLEWVHLGGTNVGTLARSRLKRKSSRLTVAHRTWSLLSVSPRRTRAGSICAASSPRVRDINP